MILTIGLLKHPLRRCLGWATPTRLEMMVKGDVYDGLRQRKTYRSVLVLAIAYPKLRLGFKTVARIITIKFQVRMK
ncbi:MAG: hypothetical protein V7K77_06190 [Nostoc sp.]|uniref:hypothetical protein n=1 Tax=Nostoc sp. TaxID=1180 RepID=UPI002FFB90DA